MKNQQRSNLQINTCNHKWRKVEVIPQQPGRTIQQSYAVLGVSEETPDSEIKKSYRRLMNQHHPDKLVAKGMPEEMIKLATEKTQEIRAAWEHIREHRAA